MEPPTPATPPTQPQPARIVDVLYSIYDTLFTLCTVGGLHPTDGQSLWYSSTRMFIRFKLQFRRNPWSHESLAGPRKFDFWCAEKDAMLVNTSKQLAICITSGANCNHANFTIRYMQPLYGRNPSLLWQTSGPSQPPYAQQPLLTPPPQNVTPLFPSSDSPLPNIPPPTTLTFDQLWRVLVG